MQDPRETNTNALLPEGTVSSPSLKFPDNNMPSRISISAENHEEKISLPSTPNKFVNPFIGERMLGLPSFGFDDEDGANGTLVPSPRLNGSLLPKPAIDSIGNGSLKPTLSAEPSTMVSDSLEEFKAWGNEFLNQRVKPTVNAVLDWPMLAHVMLSVFFTWLLGRLHFNVFLVMTWMIFFLWTVVSLHMERQEGKIRAKLLRDQLLDNQQAFSDGETTRWLNHAISRAWPIWLERMVSLKLLPKLAPWFINTYKPSPLQRLELNSMHLGKDPPHMSNARVYNTPRPGYHLTMEMDMEMICASDMFMKFTANVVGISAIPWTAYATDLHLYGKLQLSVRFLAGYPFISQVGISFKEEPRLNLAIRVMGMGLSKGFDAASLPLVAGFVDRTLKAALKASLVVPNQMVVEDVGELLSDLVDPPDEAWTGEAATVNGANTSPPPVPPESQPVAFAKIEILEGQDLMAADWNGRADPLVRGVVASAKFLTSTKKFTLNPKWNEEFRVPILAWLDPTLLRLNVRDADLATNEDDLGLCEVDLGKLRGGDRHEFWIQLQNVNRGKIHLAVTIIEEGDENDETTLVEGALTSGGEESLVETKVVEKGGQDQKPEPAQVASVTLKPKALFSNDSTDLVKDDPSSLTLRSVHLGDPRVEISPGVVIYKWDG